MTLVELTYKGESKPVTKLYVCSIKQVQTMAKRRGYTILRHFPMDNKMMIQALRNYEGWNEGK